MSPKAALLVVLWPAVAAMAVMLLSLAWRRWRFSGEAAGVAAVAIGFLTAEYLVRGMPPLIPAEATRWLPHIAFLFALAGILRAVAGGALWVLGTVGIAIGAGTLLLLGPGLDWRGSGASATGTILFAAAATGLLHMAGRRAARSPTPWLAPLLLAVVALGAGVALAQSFTASLGQLLTGLAGILCAATVMSAWWMRMGVAAGVMPAAGAMLALTVFAGRIYSYTPPPISSVLLILAAGALPAIFSAPLIRGLPLAVRAGVGLTAVGALCALAVWLTPMGFDFSE